MTPLLSGVYSPEVEVRMRSVFRSLSEKDRRRYAAVEADKLGRGAITYLSHVFGCGRGVIYHGLRELDQLASGDPVGDRIRRPGAGRPVTEEKHPEVAEQLEETLKYRIAGDPMDDRALWTDLRPRELAEQIARRDWHAGLGRHRSTPAQVAGLRSAEDRQSAARWRITRSRHAVLLPGYVD